MTTLLDSALGKRKRGDIQENNSGRTFADYLTSNKTVNIYVGSERKLYILNEDFLCDDVPFFRAAFKSDFKEGLAKQMDLPEDDSSIFEVFVEWLYGSELDGNREYPKYIPISMRKKGQGTIIEREIRLCKIWMFADKLNLTDFAEVAFERYRPDQRAKPRRPLTEELVTFVWDSMPEKAPHRSFLIEGITEQVFLKNEDRRDWLSAPALNHKEFRDAVMANIATHANLGNIQDCDFDQCNLHDRWGGGSSYSIGLRRLMMRAQREKPIHLTTLEAANLMRRRNRTTVVG